MTRPGAGGRAPALTVRPIGPHDDAAIHALFRSTIALGRPLPFELPILDEYAALCLDWYLHDGRGDGAVVENGGVFAGYVLVCTDTRAQQQWARRRAVALGRHALAAIASGRVSARARRFLLLRMRDGLALRSAPVPRPMHAHLNLHAGSHRTWAAPMLRDRVDTVCRVVGASGWYGEVNAKVGRRAVALERLVGPVVHRTPNRTCSWLAGEPVERLTVVRDLER